MSETKNKKLNERAQRIQDNLISVYASPDGKQLIDDLKDYCGFGLDVFVKDSESQTHFNLGKQHVANLITKLLK